MFTTGHSSQPLPPPAAGMSPTLNALSIHLRVEDAHDSDSSGEPTKGKSEQARATRVRGPGQRKKAEGRK